MVLPSLLTFKRQKTKTKVRDGGMRGLIRSGGVQMLQVAALCTSPGENALPFWTDGVHWAEMLTLTLLNVFLEACSNT